MNKTNTPWLAVSIIMILAITLMASCTYTTPTSISASTSTRSSVMAAGSAPGAVLTATNTTGTRDLTGNVLFRSATR
jgi:hypothetical protein